MFLHKLLLFHLGFFLLTRHAASILNLISAEKNLIGSVFFLLDSSCFTYCLFTVGGGISYCGRRVLL